VKFRTASGLSTTKAILAILILAATSIVVFPKVVASNAADATVRPLAISMPIQGTLAPGKYHRWGGVMEIAGAPVNFHITWQPTSVPIWIGLYCRDTGHTYYWEIWGGGVSGNMPVVESGINYFVVANPNPSTTVTYSGRVNWP
jgi:hypothetical protein